MDHPWSSAGIETTARAWTWRACAVAALWCGLYVVVLLPALLVYTIINTILDAVAAVVSTAPAAAAKHARRTTCSPARARGSSGSSAWCSIWWSRATCASSAPVWKSTSVSGASPKSFLGDGVAALAPSSGEEPSPPRYRAGVDGVEVGSGDSGEAAPRRFHTGRHVVGSRRGRGGCCSRMVIHRPRRCAAGPTHTSLDNKLERITGHPASGA